MSHNEAANSEQFYNRSTELSEGATFLASLHLSSSCHVAHKASTLSRQPALSAAAICTSLQCFHPAFFSLSTVLLHVVLGLLRLRRPSKLQVNAVLQSLFCSQFPHDVTDELPSPPSDVLAEVFHLSHLQDFFVCNYVLPAYLKYPSKTSALEDVDFVFIAFIHLPCLAAIQQDWLYQCLIQPDFVCRPTGLFQSQEYPTRFNYSISVDVLCASAFFGNCSS